LEVPLPAGYCEPTGADIDLAQVVAAGDNDNVTHLSLYPCNVQASKAPLGTFKDYIVVKTPRQALLVAVGREELLRSLGEEFENPAFAEAVASGRIMDESEAGPSKVLMTKLDLSGSVAPRGKDEMCAYVGGLLTVSSSVVTYTLAVGGCMTSVGERVLAIYYYGPDQSPSGVARLLMRSKEFAKSIKIRPGR
jgi:hypothetical protein